MRKQAMHNKKALLIQSAYRRMLACRCVQDMRNGLANERLLEAQQETRLQLASITIQCIVRAKLARLEAQRRMTIRDETLRVRQLRARMALLLQRYTRGWLGRGRAHRRRAEIAHYWLRFAQAIIIQRCYRGFRGRIRAWEAREAYRIQLIRKAATDLQRAWRGRRARVLATMLRALQALRIKRNRAAVLIQRNYRGYRGRLQSDAIMKERLHARAHLAAAFLIQRVYRGHKGREAAEIEAALLDMEGQAKPLLSLLATLEVEMAKQERLVSKLEAEDQFLISEVEAIGRESLYAENTTNKWTDSSRVNGIPQRFLTKFLRIRLQDVLQNAEVKALDDFTLHLSCSYASICFMALRWTSRRR